MKKLLSGLAAGVVLLVAAQSALAADVGVRVEGTPDTLVPRTVVSTSLDNQSRRRKPPCHHAPSASAGGALERATAGDWSGRWASFGDYEIQTIKGERHASNAGDSSGTYWSFWLNYKLANAGACGTPVQTGDDVLFFPSCFGCDKEPTPLRIASLPQSSQPGQPFDVRVVEYAVTYDADFNATTIEEPAGGATVTASGRDFTAGDDGVAHVTVDGRSLATVRASKAGHVRSATENVCVDCGPTFGPPPARDTSAPAGLRAARGDAGLLRDRAHAHCCRVRDHADRQPAGGQAAADPPGREALQLLLGPPRALRDSAPARARRSCPTSAWRDRPGHTCCPKRPQLRAGGATCWRRRRSMGRSTAGRRRGCASG